MESDENRNNRDPSFSEMCDILRQVDNPEYVPQPRTPSPELQPTPPPVSDNTVDESEMQNLIQYNEQESERSNAGFPYQHDQSARVGNGIIGPLLGNRLKEKLPKP